MELPLFSIAKKLINKYKNGIYCNAQQLNVLLGKLFLLYHVLEFFGNLNGIVAFLSHSRFKSVVLENIFYK